ncbi:MAG TPA: amino acid adenylation domain-containing protein, partial [Pyrinomonadaceae bacterium]|nr:amino acid adenylation domain-containing protein [Pyrinomonadaceae bacterium]
MFEAQVARTPEAVAVVSEAEEISYQELNARANQLAHYLQELGVGVESLVGVCIERSVEMVVGLLGTLKAGGAYVPLDSQYPKERLAYMLEDAGVDVLLTQQHLLENLPSHEMPVLCLDRDWEAVSGYSRENPRNPATTQNIAYVIYTSGSTGRPKGAMNTHHAISNRILWMQDAYRLTAADRVLQKTPFSFDVSVWEFFWPLATGAQLIMARPGGHQDAAYLVRLIAEQKISVTHFVPPMLQVFLQQPRVEECRSLRRVICSGEALSYELQERFFSRLPAMLNNLYGPTEAAVDVTHWTCRRGGVEHVVPIGRPIANTQIYILDAHLQPVPLRVKGEIYIGGHGLGRGYLRRPDLTAERFIPSHLSREPGMRLYRTGDAGRFLPDGQIEFLGRLDQQVKIRGYRIELGEIEAVLNQHHAVREALVIAALDPRGDHHLIAYLVSDVAVDAAELRLFLQGTLPEYMIPAGFVRLEQMPLTPNGKVDRRALPPWEATRGSGKQQMAKTETELLVAQLMGAVLKVEEVGVEESFFELGGHSLLATQLVSRVREVFGVEMGLRAVFGEGTARAMSRVIEEAMREGRGVGGGGKIERVGREGMLPLSYAQQRLWFIDQMEPGSVFYNVPLAIRLSGHLNIEALAATFTTLFARHEVLRTTFAMHEGQPVQVISPPAPVSLPLEDLSGLSHDEREHEAQRLAREEASLPFDLSQGPLLRVRLLRMTADEHICLITMHHIVSDGWSLDILSQEVAALYEAYVRGEASPLAELPIQYADYAVWQRQYLQGEVLEQQMEYWRTQLGGHLPTLELPADHPLPTTPTHRGARQSFVLAADTVERLRALCRSEGATLFMVLLAAFKTLLYRYTGEEDVVVGTP